MKQLREKRAVNVHTSGHVEGVDMRSMYYRPPDDP